jgi:hypothetical protein
MLFKSRRARGRALLAVALCAGAVGVVPAAAQATGGGNLALPKVMTRNLYLGADLNPAIAAIQQCPSLPAQQCQGLILATNQGIWNHVVATNFPARAKRLAKEIDDDDPYIVALQEVALWRSGPVNGVKDATVVDYDFLASLLSELSARGTHYKAIVTQQEADIESPSGTPPTFADARDRRLTMRDVILVRTDLPSALVSFSNPQSGNYANYISLPTGTTYGAIDFKRGWASIDIKLLGHPVARFVDTHLESAATGVRFQQASELVGPTGPVANPAFPAIIAGDLNSDPSIPFGGNPASGASDGLAFSAIAGAGFVDSGNTTNTFGHNADLNDFPSNVFSERIDHVMFRPGGFTGLLTNKVVGTDPANRTPGGLWPSDHAGLIVGIG